jgi:ribonuclease R
MILANVAVAQALEKARVPSLDRVHGQAEAEKLERLTSTLSALGIDARIPERVSTRDLQAIARRIGSAPERAFVESLVVRAMPQAVYQPTNIGHFGLALSHYAHFTSPIRRYPDLVVHRTLKALIGDTSGAAVRHETRRWSLRESTSRLEKRADEADAMCPTTSSALSQGTHRPDLPGTHHHGGRVRLLRADPGRLRRRAAAHR